MALRADDVDVARDRDLVDQFQTGEVRAFEDLYNRYFDRVRRSCLRQVGDAYEAEEIAQEVFARAYVAFPNLGGPRHAYAWLSVVASRLCVDTHRRRARTQPAAEVERVEISLDDDRLETEADLAHVRAAVARLKPRHREVLDLRETQGWSYQQIAEHYDVSLGTVEALLFRARHALRREFAAVAGARRDLAALPVIGAILRRLTAARERIEPWVSALAPAPYAELTTVVAMVATIGLALGPAAAPDTPPLRAGAVGPSSSGLGGLDDIPTSTTGDVSSVASAPAPHYDDPDQGGAGRGDIATPQAMDFDTARRNAESEPTHASNDLVAVGADPDEFVTATLTASEAYAEQANDWISSRRLP